MSQEEPKKEKEPSKETKKEKELTRDKIIELLTHSDLTHDRIAAYTGSTQPYVSQIADELEIERESARAARNLKPDLVMCGRR